MISGKYYLITFLIITLTKSLTFDEEEKSLTKRQMGCQPGCSAACAPACNPDCCSTTAKGVSSAFLNAAAAALCPPNCVPIPGGGFGGFGAMNGGCPPGCAPSAPPLPPPPPPAQPPSPVAAIQAAALAAQTALGLISQAYSGMCPPVCQTQCSGCNPQCCAALLARCSQNAGLANCH